MGVADHPSCSQDIRFRPTRADWSLKPDGPPPLRLLATIQGSRARSWGQTKAMPITATSNQKTTKRITAFCSVLSQPKVVDNMRGFMDQRMMASGVTTTQLQALPPSIRWPQNQEDEKQLEAWKVMTRFRPQGPQQ